jgi:hypothetical protein
MPWYTNPMKTCAVLNRIAKRFSVHQMVELRQAMDAYTMLLWNKQEAYYAKN